MARRRSYKRAKFRTGGRKGRGAPIIASPVHSVTGRRAGRGRF